MDALGNFVVVWQSRFQDGDGEGIFGQRFGPTGAPVGVEFQVNTHTISHQSHPDVAVDGQGGFVVVWRSESQDGDSAGIFGQRFDPTGAPDGPEFQINTYSLYDQVRPAVATNESGNFAVAWESYRQDGSLYGVFGQRFDDTGGPLGDEFQVNSFTDADQFFPSVAMDGSGRFVVMWESAEQDGSGYGIIGQSFDSSGERIGGEFQANTYTEDFQFDPSIAMNASGDFVVVWVSGGQDGSGRGIFGQRFVLLEPCEEPDPRNQGFWYRQCLGAGLIGPGRAGRGPQGNIDDFVDVIEPAVSSRLQATVSVDSACEDGMDADPQSDPCEKALKQYTALLFNLESDRLCTSCGIDLVSEGCVSPSVGELVDELAGLINSDGGESCKLAMRCAAAVNTGSAVNSR